jgi:hypothetical protein
VKVYIITTDEGGLWHMLTDHGRAHELARWSAHQNRVTLLVQEYDLSTGYTPMLPHTDGWKPPTEYEWAASHHPQVTTFEYGPHGKEIDVNYYDHEHGDMVWGGLLSSAVYKQIADRIKQGSREGTVWCEDPYSPAEIRYDFDLTDPLPAPTRPTWLA